MRFKVLAIGLVVGLLFGGGGWLLRRYLTQRPVPAGSAPAGKAVPADGSLFADVFRTVRNHAVDSLDDASLYRMATEGVLTEVGDPYAAVVSEPAGEVPRQGEPPVQGLYLDEPEGLIEVVAVVPGSPAADAGIRPGDAVLRVEDTRIELQRAAQVRRLIEGADGTTVRIRLGRDGSTSPLWVTLRRGPVPEWAATEVKAVAPSIAMVRLHRLDGSAGATVRRAVDSARSAGVRGLVLDLRGVVEGRLDDALQVAEPFLDGGQVVARTRAKVAADSTVLRDAGAGTEADLALVVLVDRGTAGAAEVVAGALQDNDRGLLVGEVTFGRGASQTIFPLQAGRGLRLTTRLWLTPSGRVIQRLSAPTSTERTDTAVARPSFKTAAGRTILGGGGIVPDREIAAATEGGGAPDPALAAALDLLAKATTRKTLLAALDSK